MRMRDKERSIHVWDGASLARAALRALAVEAVFVGLSLLGQGGAGGAPHNFPDNPFVILFIIFHLPSLFAASVLGLGAAGVVAIQTVLLTYALFVWLRLRKIKVGLH